MKKQHIKLSESDKKDLENLIATGNHSARQYKRAIALLELNRGKTFTSVSQTVGVVHQTVSEWAKTYRESGLEVLQDKPKPGRPTLIDGLSRAKITALACSDPPEGYSQWSLRLLADKAVELEYVDSISHTEVGRLLKKTKQNRT